MGALVDLVKVLFEPVPVFERIKEKPRFLVGWLGLAAIAIVVAVLVRPFTAAAMRVFVAALPPEQAARIPTDGGSVVQTVVGTPVFLLAMLLLGALLLWGTTAITGADAKFRTVLSVLTYCFVTYSIVSVITIIVLTLRGVEAVRSFDDLRAPIGLDLLVPNARGFVGSLLNGINPFAVWGVWLAGTGVSITHGTSRASGYTAAAIAYAVGLAIFSVVINLAGMLMGGGS